MDIVSTVCFLEVLVTNCSVILLVRRVQFCLLFCVGVILREEHRTRVLEGAEEGIRA